MEEVTNYRGEITAVARRRHVLWAMCCARACVLGR